MMYEVDIEVLKTNDVNDKVKTVVKLTHGVIHQLGIYFPPGCANTIHTVINRGLYQIFPTNPDGTIKGDSINVEGREFYTVIKAPYQVEVVAWADGATYDHTITVRLWLMKIWQLMPFSDEMYMLSLQEGAGALT